MLTCFYNNKKDNIKQQTATTVNKVIPVSFLLRQATQKNPVKNCYLFNWCNAICLPESIFLKYSYLETTVNMVKGALDKFNIIPLNFFQKKLGFLYH